MSESPQSPSAQQGQPPQEESGQQGHVPQAPSVRQPVTDDSIRVRQVSHYQFSWVAQEPGEEGVFTLQLVLDQGAWEEVLTVDADDADVLQDLLSSSKHVQYDIGRRTLMFGTSAVGEG